MKRRRCCRASLLTVVNEATGLWSVPPRQAGMGGWRYPDTRPGHLHSEGGAARLSDVDPDGCRPQRRPGNGREPDARRGRSRRDGHRHRRIPPRPQTTSSKIGSNITSTEIDSLPSQGRNQLGLMQLVPGLTPSLNPEYLKAVSSTPTVRRRPRTCSWSTAHTTTTIAAAARRERRHESRSTRDGR